MKIWMTTFLILGLTFGAATVVTAQEDSNVPATEQQQKEKAEQEKKAYALLEQVVDEAQLLRLPENRIRIQIGAADVLWQRNEGRARSLFALAADSVAEMMRAASTSPSPDERRSANQGRTDAQLRQELVLTVARYDAPLAYQMLALTRPPTPTAGTSNPRFPDAEDNLEERLLAQVAALDPKLAMQNAEQMLDKGQYSRSLAQVLAQLQVKDKEAAAKLEEKMVKRLQSANMLSMADAGTLALSLLLPGPRPAERGATTTSASLSNTAQMLAPSAYTGLLGSVIDAALKATAPPAGSQRRSDNFRGRRNSPGGGGGGQINAATEPSAAELEQRNARRLLGGLHTVLPQIDQYLPARAQAVRQKMTEMGIVDNSRAGMTQAFGAMQEKIDGSKTAEVRETLVGLRSDDERIDLLLQLSGRARQNNPKLAVELLNEARQFTNRRAASYRQFEQQLRVADAFKDLEPARSFEILEPGIAQLNELLSAAATLSGFEVNVFQDGELPLEGRNGLSNMVTRYGQVLGLLAKRDFDHSETLANRFQLSEPRIVARLSIVRSMLGLEPGFSTRRGEGRRFSQNTFIRSPE